MSNEEIIEGNKLIALFDGYEFIDDYKDVYPNGYYWINEGCGNNSKEIEEFEYHLSWDWLMPVVEKIESLGELVSIEENRCLIINKKDTELHEWIVSKSIIKIESVWQSIIQFIKWYNTQKDGTS